MRKKALSLLLLAFEGRNFVALGGEKERQEKVNTVV